MSFGQSSERIERAIEQLELKLEEIETTAAGEAVAALSQPDPTRPASPEKKPRRKLPEHLPRREERHEPATSNCPRCGSERPRKVGEDVTEVLEYVPGRFEVVRHVRPAYSCPKCEAMTRAPMPAMPIPRAMAGASVLAHVIVSKYADHLPLYRQAEISTRATALISIAAPWLTGWARRRGCCARSPNALAAM
jgi:transposase